MKTLNESIKIFKDNKAINERNLHKLERKESEIQDLNVKESNKFQSRANGMQTKANK